MARQQGSIMELCEEPWGLRTGFRRSDGKIVSIRLGTLFSSNAECVRCSGQKELERKFITLGFNFSTSMKFPSGRRSLLGLSPEEGEGLVVDVDLESPCPEGYKGMQDVVRYHDSYLKVETLDSQFPEKTPVTLDGKVPMQIEDQTIKVTF